MDASTVNIGLTAAVGVAGILSTHLLARAQSRAESTRTANERRSRYRFAEHEVRIQLYADYVSELRTLSVTGRMRATLASSYLRMQKAAPLVADMREGAEDAGRPGEERAELGRFAEAIERDPGLADRIARRDGWDKHLPPAVEAVPVVRRLTELHARITVVCGSAMSQAATKAHASGMALVFRLEAAELGYFDEEVNFEELDDAIFELVSAAIYELRLRPYGEKLDLDELKKQAVRDFEGSTAQPDQAESGTK